MKRVEEILRKILNELDAILSSSHRLSMKQLDKYKRYIYLSDSDYLIAEVSVSAYRGRIITSCYINPVGGLLEKLPKELDKFPYKNSYEDRLDMFDKYCQWLEKHNFIDITDKFYSSSDIAKMVDDSITNNATGTSTKLIERLIQIVDASDVILSTKDAKYDKYFDADINYKIVYSRIFMPLAGTLADARQILTQMLEVKLVDDIEERVKQLNQLIRRLYIVLPRLKNLQFKKTSYWNDEGYSNNDVRNIYVDKTKVSNEAINHKVAEESSKVDKIATITLKALEELKRPIIPDDESSIRADIDGSIITIKEADSKLINLVKNKLGGLKSRLVNCWYVDNAETHADYEQADMYDEDEFGDEYVQNTQLLFHGSITANWINIIKEGLSMPKKAGMFGKGIYFADDPEKSLGYTSIKNSRWANGEDPTGFLGLFYVRLGKVYKTYKAMSSLNAYNIPGGCDSVKGIKGKDLMRDEYCIYDRNRCTIYAVIEIGL